MKVAATLNPAKINANITQKVKATGVPNSQWRECKRFGEKYRGCVSTSDDVTTLDED